MFGSNAVWLHAFNINTHCTVCFVKVYPHVATGFADTSAFLRELTLKSMLVLAPKVALLFQLFFSTIQLYLYLIFIYLFFYVAAAFSAYTFWIPLEIPFQITGLYLPRCYLNIFDKFLSPYMIRCGLNFILSSGG